MQFISCYLTNLVADLNEKPKYMADCFLSEIANLF